MTYKCIGQSRSQWGIRSNTIALFTILLIRDKKMIHILSLLIIHKKNLLIDYSVSLMLSLDPFADLVILQEEIFANLNMIIE